MKSTPEENLLSIPDMLRISMRQWTTGVTIVSSRWKEEQHGMTVSSFTSISLDPPLVAVSLAKKARTHRLVVTSNIFGVTILSESQQELSEKFAGRIGENADRFAGLEPFYLITGAPFLPGGLVWLDCQVESRLDTGSNTVFLGKVLAVRHGEGGAPLLYYDRNYQKICEE
jgi:flavin reductase (DIM6/NTAB) family NADH-FMN oxidoreductase RutF